MSDLLSVLPDLPLSPQTHRILSSLDKNNVTIADLLTLDQLEVSKRISVSLLDLRRFLKEVVRELHTSLESTPNTDSKQESSVGIDHRNASFGMTGFDAWKTQRFISTGDVTLDSVLGGGIMTGSITEVVGESGAGKTQLLLQLCCVIQLPRELGGLSKTAMYISTEGPISTSRLVQLLTSFKSRYADNLTSDDKLSTDNVLTITCPDLETQEHILNYQLPVAVEKHNIGLIVLDSVAANFRAEYESVSKSILFNNSTAPPRKRTRPELLAERGKQLVKMAHALRNLARTYDIAVVVANQVSDRFDNGSRPPKSASDGEVLTLDHQARWFTGWGDEKHYVQSNDKKVPALGLVWTNCIGARIALLKTLSYRSSDDESWQRRMKVVFMPWAEGGSVCRYVIETGGVKGVTTDAD